MVHLEYERGHLTHPALKRKREVEEGREDATAEPSGLVCALPGCEVLRAPHLGEMRTICREMVRYITVTRMYIFWDESVSFF